MIQNAPVYAALTASSLVVLQLFLMFLVGNKRSAYGQGLGDGGKPDLLMAIRRHGNLAENAALFIVVLALLELTVGSSITVLGLGLAFLAVRLAHAIGLTIGDGPNPARIVGALGTLVTMSGAAIYLAYATLTEMM